MCDVRAGDLAALPIDALMARVRPVNRDAPDDTIMVCTNPASADNRDAARAAVLLAGPPATPTGRMTRHPHGDCCVTLP